jgi:hypothetical protein
MSEESRKNTYKMLKPEEFKSNPKIEIGIEKCRKTRRKQHKIVKK